MSQVALILELVEGGTLADRIYDPCKRRLDALETLQARQPSSMRNTGSHTGWTGPDQPWGVAVQAAQPLS
jgi:hypothetical protein